MSIERSGQGEVTTAIEQPRGKPLPVETEAKKENYDPPQGVEVVMDDVGDLSEILEGFCKRGHPAEFILIVKNGRAPNIEAFTPALARVLQGVIDSGNMKEGQVRVTTQRGGERVRATDEWHDDGFLVYIYASKLPTEILRNPKGRYHVAPSGTLVGTPRPEDVWKPPNQALIKMLGDVIHRRPPEAVGVAERYFMKIFVGHA